VEKTSPATAAGKPAAEHVDAAPAATAEGGTGAESPPASGTNQIYRVGHLSRG